MQSSWQRWAWRPQTLAWRNVLVQVHLWTGVALALYVAVLSLTGSLIVLRPDIHRWLTQPELAMRGDRLAGNALQEAVRRTYAGYEITSLRQPRRPQHPVTVTLLRNGEKAERLFDPYAAADIGLAYPPVLNVVEWTVDLHDNLLTGHSGRVVNGLGGVLLTLLCITGLIVWWPGRTRWQQAMLTGPPAKTRVFARRLHVSLGFWISSLMFIWAITAIYFAFPSLFDNLIDLLDADPADADRPGEHLLELIVRLHFGRFGGLPGKMAWMILGLLPAVLVITGIVVWWRRIRPRQTMLQT